MLLPLGVALFALGIALASGILLSHVLAIAKFAPILGSLIGLGVGIDYALFIVTRSRQELKRGATVEEAVIIVAQYVRTSGTLRRLDRLHRSARHADLGTVVLERGSHDCVVGGAHHHAGFYFAPARASRLSKATRPEPAGASGLGEGRARPRRRERSVAALGELCLAPPSRSHLGGVGRHHRLHHRALLLSPARQLRPGLRPGEIHDAPGVRPPGPRLWPRVQWSTHHRGRHSQPE